MPAQNFPANVQNGNRVSSTNPVGQQGTSTVSTGGGQDYTNRRGDRHPGVRS